MAAQRAVRGVAKHLGLVAAVVAASLPLLFKPQPLPLPQPQASHFESRRLLTEAIPPDAVVAAQTIIVPHLPIVPTTSLFPYNAATADYVALMPDENPWPLEAADYRNEVEQLLSSGNFGVIANNGKLVVLKRGAPSGDVDGVRALLPK